MKKRKGRSSKQAETRSKTHKATRIQIPKRLDYAEEGGVCIKIRRPEAHDEPDPGKRIRLQKVRNFIAKIKWVEIKEEEQGEEKGMTWLELYILYAIHGGWSKQTEKTNEVNL